MYFIASNHPPMKLAAHQRDDVRAGRVRAQRPVPAVQHRRGRLHDGQRAQTGAVTVTQRRRVHSRHGGFVRSSGGEGADEHQAVDAGRARPDGRHAAATTARLKGRDGPDRRRYRLDRDGLVASRTMSVGMGRRWLDIVRATTARNSGWSASSGNIQDSGYGIVLITDTRTQRPDRHRRAPAFGGRRWRHRRGFEHLEPYRRRHHQGVLDHRRHVDIGLRLHGDDLGRPDRVESGTAAGGGGVAVQAWLQGDRQAGDVRVDDLLALYDHREREDTTGRVTYLSASAPSACASRPRAVSR